MTIWMAAICSALVGMIQFRLCMRHLEGDAERSDQVAALVLAVLAAIPPVMAANGLFQEPFVFVFMVMLGTASMMGFVNAMAMGMTFADQDRHEARTRRAYQRYRRTR